MARLVLLVLALSLTGCQSGTQLFLRSIETPEHLIYQWQHRHDLVKPIPVIDPR